MLLTGENRGMERKHVSVDIMSVVNLAWIALGSNLILRRGNSTTNLRSLHTVFKAKDKRELYAKIKVVPHSKHFLYVISTEIFAFLWHRTKQINEHNVEFFFKF